MHGFFRDLVEIYRQVDKEEVGTGFLDGWESQGTFCCAIAESINTVMSLGQQVSYYSGYRITFPENPGIRYKATRFLVVEGRHKDRWLEPDNDPKEYGDAYNMTTVVECVAITNLLGQQDDTTEDSDADPPEIVTYVEDEFEGDDLQTVFILSEEIQLGSSVVTVAGEYRVRGVDYTEQSDRIVFNYPPQLDQVIAVRALPA